MQRPVFGRQDFDYKPSVPVVALRVDVQAREHEIPIHQHESGQLVIALRGAVTCDVPGALWMVPPQAGVWIPGGTPHSNRSTANAVLFFLFIAPGAAALPARCCTLRLSPMLSEMIQYLAGLPPTYEPGSATDRLAHVLLDQLCTMPAEELFLPMPQDARLRRISQAITLDPSDRRTLSDWAHELATSERTLNRLCTAQTGLSFGRWRRQLHMIVALRELSGGATVQQVAYDLGYESPSAFITMFKKAFGKPPATYISDRLRVEN
ncbi:AraC family transcriptional regulator [Variovorax sp. PAMC26660]|uniref:AraC family transcriptional regulator n=1 Tax=Variovorax sp. PAMC26660 TaxID=2762322 RepID=UPI00164DCF3D|nr:helix-turn-helix transcriptional regulator [Variovorax sp. PAMC26660]QNK69267.1 helix-turn-helix transcriptional regulator [Variovorax sp. PAMC26660]